MSYGAKWSGDGKTLVLLGGLGAPGMSSLNRTTTQLYSVQLTRTKTNPDDRGVDTEAEAEGRAGRLSRPGGLFGGIPPAADRSRQAPMSRSNGTAWSGASASSRGWRPDRS